MGGDFIAWRFNPMAICGFGVAHMDCLMKGGVTIVVAGPAIAAWVASAANTVTIAASVATTVLYQVGETIEYVRAAPMIPKNILG